MNFNMKSVVFVGVSAIGCAAFPASVAAQHYNPRLTYPNPDGDMAEVKRRGPCGDPWLSLALHSVYGTADPAKCNVSLYNGGRWNNYNELVHAVAKHKNAGTGGASASLPTLDLSRIKYQCPAPNSCNIYSNSGDKVGLLSNGNFQPEVPARIVAAGGGNIVAAGGGNIVAAGGGNLVGNDGASLISKAVNMNPPASPMGGYALQGVNDFRALTEKTRHR